MPKVSTFPPGTFSWVELSTTDAKAAKSFYTGVFGWGVNEIPMGDQGSYFIFRNRESDAAAMYEEVKQPPHWTSYIAVAGADAAAEKARSLGGQIVAGPFDVFDLGRMAFVMDPQGAMFAIWEAKKRAGLTIVNEPGALCWNELYTSDIEAARKYYSALFGWKLKVSPEYTEIYTGETPIGGMMQMAGMPPNWMPYFAVNDADAICKKAKSLGGKVHKEPTDIPNAGRFAVLADPQGAGFSIIKLAH